MLRALDKAKLNLLMRPIELPYQPISFNVNYTANRRNYQEKSYAPTLPTKFIDPIDPNRVNTITN